MRKRIFQYIAGVFLFSSLFALADRIDFGAMGWLFDLAVHFTPHLFLAGVVISATMFFFKARKMLIAVVIMTGVHTYSVFSLSNFSRPISNETKSSNSITVITANIWKSEHALSQLANLADLESADVIAISEMTENTCKDLSKIFPQYPFCKIVKSNENGAPLSNRMALISKDEPLSFSIVAEPDFRNRAILNVVYRLVSREFQIVIVHPVAPGSPAHMRDRNHVLRATNQLVGDQQNFILMGDMNTTPWSRISRQLPGIRAGDPKTESTWLTRLPILGLPIDHIRFGDSLQLNGYRIGHHIGSDHLPLVAEFQFIDPESKSQDTSFDD